MSTSEGLRYYGRHEICMHKRLGHLYCDQFSKPNNMECAVNARGPGHTAQKCPHVRTILLRHDSTNDTSKTGNILDLIYTLKSKGYENLIFMGDSVSQQSYWDAYCSLSRFGLVSILANKTENTQFSAIYFDITFLPDNAISEDIPSKFSNTFRVLYYSANKSDMYTMTVIRKMVESNEMIDTTKDKAVYILNQGLHYNQETVLMKSEFTEYFKYFLNLTATYGDNQLIIFRETTAQHFSTGDGTFPSSHRGTPKHTYLSTPDTLKNTADNVFHTTGFAQRISNQIQIIDEEPTDFDICRPLNHTQILAQGWRNSVALNILREIDPENLIKVAKFYEISAARYDAHFDSMDCTHWCNNPMFWLPMWNNINLILKKTFGQK